MRGFALESGGDFITEFPNEVVAVIADESFPQAKITEMLSTCPWPEVVWVCRDSDRTAKAAFDVAGIEYVAVPLNAYFKVVDTGAPVEISFKETTLEDGTVHRTALKKPRVTYPDAKTLCDVRSNMRECEFMYACTHILIFRNLASDASAHWEGRMSARAQISVIEHGKRGRKKRVDSRQGAAVRGRELSERARGEG